MKKWNYDTRSYDEYQIPDSWWCPHLAEMEAAINCVSCGARVFMGDAYTSLEIHNDAGFGYNVCETCHGEELARREAAQQKENELAGHDQ